MKDFEAMFAKMKRTRGGSGSYLRVERNYRYAGREYSLEEIINIVNSGSVSQMAKLSRHFFQTNGLYRRIVLYFSTMLLYESILSPRFDNRGVPEKKVFLPNFQQALRFMDDMSIPKELVRIFTTMLVDGSYAGLVQMGKKLMFADLPMEYCRSRFRSPNDNQILEFNVQYFSSIQRYQDEVISSFPDTIINYYERFKAGKETSPWYICSEDEGVFFTCSLDGNAGTVSAPPFFAQIIPAIARLKEYQDADLEIAKEELSKLVISKIPLDKDNELAFEPEEIQATHNGIAEMLRDNPHVDVITTFCDTEVASLGSHSEAVRRDLDNISKLVYNEAGVTKQVFNNDSAMAIKLSVANDLSLVMSLLRPFQHWVTWLINDKFTKNEIFSYEFALLPISYYNREDIYNLYVKGAQYGYSKFLAGSALGIKQSDLMALVTIENDFLDLGNRMIPLRSSHTTSGKETGAPKKDLEDLSQKSIDNRESE